MTDVQTVLRTDLDWALRACLPHVGDRISGLDFVGLSYRPDDVSYQAYATDRYSIGVANIFGATAPNAYMPEIHIPVSEVKELVRWLKPTLKRHRTDHVQLLVNDLELHVGIVPVDDSDGENVAVIETAVFEMRPVNVFTYEKIYEIIHRAAVKINTAHPVVLLPRTNERFSKAERDEHDRMRLYSSDYGEKGFGSAVVTVGSDFLGAVGFVGPGNPEAFDVESFRDSTLADWGL